MQTSVLQNWLVVGLTSVHAESATGVLTSLRHVTTRACVPPPHATSHASHTPVYQWKVLAGQASSPHAMLVVGFGSVQYESATTVTTSTTLDVHCTVRV